MLRTLRSVAFHVILCGAAIVFSLTAFITFRALVNPPTHTNVNVEFFRAAGRGRAGDGQFFEIYYGNLGERISGPDKTTNPHAPLIFLGGSLTWGHGVQNQQTFAAVLAHNLKIDVINLARAGAGTVLNMLLFEQLRQLAPKQVVYLLYEDHIYRNFRQCAAVDHPLCHSAPVLKRNGDTWAIIRPSWPLAPLAGDYWPLVRRFYLTRHRESPRSFGDDWYWAALATFSDVYKFLAVKPSDYTGSEIIDGLGYVIRRLNRDVRSRGGQLIVVWFPNYSYPIPLHGPPEDVRSVIEAAGVSIVDPTPLFNAHLHDAVKDHTTYPFLIPNDGHFNALGHKIVADVLEKVLAEDAPVLGSK